jgi:hypothetical protein
MARTLARMLLLFAVLLMPLGMSPAAAAPVHHETAAGMPSHCPDQLPGHEKRAGIAECTMACAAALPAVQAPAAEAPALRAEPPRFAAADPLHGLHPETATPPPKAS